MPQQVHCDWQGRSREICFSANQFRERTPATASLKQDRTLCIGVSKFISSVWDFAQATIDDTGYATHDFFRWYGKLVPQLVRRIIELYTEPGDRILANFAGSGTVLVEADLLGRHVVGMDSNPLATLVCRA